jgi:hypothetical protein
MIPGNRGLLAFNLIWLWEEVQRMPDALRATRSLIPEPPFISSVFGFEQAHEALAASGLGAAAAWLAVLADKVVAVHNVFLGKEFGLTEALWVLELKDFPAIVAIDTHGRSLLRRVQQSSRRVLRKLMDTHERFVP